MNFLKNGTKVVVMDTDMKATIIGVCIRGVENCTIEYNVQWISPGGIEQAWLYDYQVKEYIDNSRPAGMVNYSTEIQIK